MKINCPIHVSAPLPLCRPKLIQSTPSHATSWWVTSHFCKSSLPFWLSYKDMVCIFQLSHAVLTCTVCLVLLWLDRPLIWSRLRIFFSILFTPQWLRFRFCRNILFAETSLCGFRRVRNIAKSDLASFSLSVRMVDLGHHWTDFHDVWYSRTTRKSVETFQVWLKSDNDWYFLWVNLW